MKKIISTILFLAMMLSFFNICALASEYSFEITAISYTDGNLTELSEMRTGNTAFIAVTVKKTDTSSAQPTVLTAVYNESGALFKTFISRASGMANGVSITFANEYTLPQNFESHMVKAFVFTNLSTATAAAKSVSKPLYPDPEPSIPDEEDTLSFASEDIYDIKTTIDGGVGNIALFTDKDLGTYETYGVNISEFYYNGEATNISDFANYISSSVAADVKLINKTNGIYTVAYVVCYTDILVSDINADKYKLYSDDGTLILDETNTAYNFTIYKNGEKISFSDIQVGDVVSYAGTLTSNSLKSGTVIVTSETVTGSITSYDKFNYTVTVDDTTYRYDPQKISLGSDASCAADIGDYIEFYINARGVVCDNNLYVRNPNFKYGFATLLAKGIGIEGDMLIRIMDTTGNWETHKLANRISINGSKAQNIYDVDWLTVTGKTVISNRYVINDIVAYETTDDKITKIFFIDSKKFDITDNTDVEAVYSESTATLGDVVLDEDTVIFSVNSNADLSKDIDENAVSVGRMDGLIDKTAYPYGFKAYNVNINRIAAVIYGKNLL